MPQRKLDPALEQALRSAVFDESRPGPVLHDFQVVLDYIGTEGVQAGGKYNLLPMASIPVLNPRLTRQVHLELERPKLNSHPYLQGLHLLLRATGLVLVQGKGKTARLMPNPATLASWQQLTPLERYFTLLEAWLIHGREEMVGERTHMLDKEGFLPTAVMIFGEYPGVTLDFAKRLERLLHFGIQGWHHLALLDLFGLVTVTPQTETPDRILASRRVSPGQSAPTTFGMALMSLLTEQDSLLFPVDLEEEDSTAPVRFGILYPWFQPWFPQLQHTLEVPTEDGPHEGVYVFKLSLGKNAWRVLALSPQHTLDNLVSLILRSIDFDSDHLYELTWRDRLGRTVRAVHPFMDEGIPADEVELGSLPMRPGDVLHLHYDFGDDWRFEVKLERIDPPESVQGLPKILETKGKSPQQYPNWD